MSMPAEYPTATRRKRSVSGWLLKTVLLGPFRFLWWMASRVERATGILFTLIVGALLIGAGLVLNSTMIGFVLGVPMLVVGVFLVLRALY